MGNKNSKKRKLEIIENIPKVEEEEDEYSISYEVVYETLDEEEIRSEIEKDELFRLRKMDKVKRELGRGFKFAGRMIQNFSSLEVNLGLVQDDVILENLHCKYAESELREVDKVVIEEKKVEIVNEETGNKDNLFFNRLVVEEVAEPPREGRKEVESVPGNLTVEYPKKQEEVFLETSRVEEIIERPKSDVLIQENYRETTVLRSEQLPDRTEETTNPFQRLIDQSITNNDTVDDNTTMKNQDSFGSFQSFPKPKTHYPQTEEIKTVKISHYQSVSSENQSSNIQSQMIQKYLSGKKKKQREKPTSPEIPSEEKTCRISKKIRRPKEALSSTIVNTLRKSLERGDQEHPISMLYGSKGLFISLEDSKEPITKSPLKLVKFIKNRDIETFLKKKSKRESPFKKLRKKTRTPKKRKPKKVAPNLGYHQSVTTRYLVDDGNFYEDYMRVGGGGYSQQFEKKLKKKKEGRNRARGRRRNPYQVEAYNSKKEYKRTIKKLKHSLNLTTSQY